MFEVWLQDESPARLSARARMMWVLRSALVIKMTYSVFQVSVSNWWMQRQAYDASLINNLFDTHGVEYDWCWYTKYLPKRRSMIFLNVNQKPSVFLNNLHQLFYRIGFCNCCLFWSRFTESLLKTQEDKVYTIHILKI